MEIRVGDTLKMKKKHPCGCDRFLVLRVGLDFKLRCLSCGREIMTPRLKIRSAIKEVIPGESDAG